MPFTQDENGLHLTPVSNRVPRNWLIVALVTLVAQSILLSNSNSVDNRIIAALCTPVFLVGIFRYLKTPRITLTWKSGQEHWTLIKQAPHEQPKRTQIPSGEVKFRLVHDYAWGALVISVTLPDKSVHEIIRRKHHGEPNFNHLAKEVRLIEDNLKIRISVDKQIVGPR